MSAVRYHNIQTREITTSRHYASLALSIVDMTVAYWLFGFETPQITQAANSSTKTHLPQVYSHRDQ